MSNRTVLLLVLIAILAVSYLVRSAVAESDVGDGWDYCVPMTAQEQTVHPAPPQLVPLKPMNNREVMLIRNTHPTNTVYIGGDTGVTPGNGFPIFPGETLELRVGDTAVYAVANGSLTTFRVLEYASCK